MEPDTESAGEWNGVRRVGSRKLSPVLGCGALGSASDLSSLPRPAGPMELTDHLLFTLHCSFILIHYLYEAISKFHFKIHSSALFFLFLMGDLALGLYSHWLEQVVLLTTDRACSSLVLSPPPPCTQPAALTAMKPLS